MVRLMGSNDKTAFVKGVRLGGEAGSRIGKIQALETGRYPNTFGMLGFGGGEGDDGPRGVYGKRLHST